MTNRYTNLDGTTPDKGLGDILKWQIVDRVMGRRPQNDDSFATPTRNNDGSVLRTNVPSLTWIGHATFAMRLGGKVIVTDPIWSDRVGPVTKRLAAPGISLAQMPPIDIVTI